MDPQERQRRQRELQLQQDREAREKKKLARQGGDPTSLVPQQGSPLPPPPQINQQILVTASPQGKHIPDYALKISFGVPEVAPPLQCYTRKKMMLLPDEDTHPSPVHSDGEGVSSSEGTQIISPLQVEPQS